MANGMMTNPEVILNIPLYDFDEKTIEFIQVLAYDGYISERDVVLSLVRDRMNSVDKEWYEKAKKIYREYTEVGEDSN